MANLLGGKGRAAFNPINLHYVPRDVYMHPVSEEDLEALAGSGDGLYLAAFGVAVGACISLVTTVQTINISDPKKYAAFVAMAWLSGFVAIFSGIKVIQARLRLNAKIDSYREASKKMTSSSVPTELIVPLRSADETPLS